MTRKKLKLKSMLNQPIQGWKNSTGVRVLLFLLIALMLYFSLSDRLVSETYDIQVNSISEREIKSPVQFEHVAATEKAKEEAGKSVSTVYADIPMRNSELVDHIFDKLEQINSDHEFNTTEKVGVFSSFFPSEYDFFFSEIVQQIQNNEPLSAEMNKKLNEQRYRIPEEVYYKFPRLTSSDLNVMKPVARRIITQIMSEQVFDAELARMKVAELVNASDLSQQLARELVQEIVRFAITPNRFIDEQARLQAIAEAEASVEPVIINKNDVIVSAGQLITENLYHLLDEMGLLQNKEDYWTELGLVIMILLLLFILYVFIRQNKLPISANNSPLVMLAIILLLNIAGMKIVALGQSVNYPYIGYLAPVALGSMLIVILLEIRLALIFSVIFSLLASIIFNIEYPELIFDFRYGFVALISCFIAIFAINRTSQRSTIIKAGLLISIFSCISILGLTLLGDQYIWQDLLLSIAFAFGGGMLTAILVVGLLPFFEVTFGILSPLKLVELSNPNHPLLRKLLTETPGTYHHSVMVGNLSETAAESIGANGLLCRVGSFYHDVGKTKRPSYFIENQVNKENPHDHIDPDLSKSIIIAHARDGAEMLREHKMPKQICDIAEQHHGTSLLKYFYHKALKQEEENPSLDEPIKEDDFRYPGPKAQSKEAAIVGISDCVEAAVRSLSSPTIEQIGSMVDKIIKDRLEDGQFNECDLTLKELNTIAKTLKETLLGIFHSRIEYPDLTEQGQVKGVRKA